MKKLFFTGLLFTISVFHGYGQAKDSKYKTYHFNKVGWTVAAPTGWEIITNEAFDKMEKKGLDTIQSGNDKDISDKLLDEQVINLLSVKKDQTTYFLSSIQKFNTRKYGFSQSMDVTDSLLTATFLKMNMKCDTSSEIVKVDGLPFHVFHATVHASKDATLYADLYCRLINGYLFSESITYMTNSDKITLMGIIRNSTFEIRN